MNRAIDNILNQAGVELLFRWLIGMTFIYASSHKIIFPAKFAEIIYGYFLFPSQTIHLIAIVVPFLEMVSGVALILGIYPRSAALILSVMLLIFIGILSFNMARGLKFDCGCFSFGDAGNESATVRLIIRDAVLFMMGLYVVLYRKIRKRCILQTGSIFGAVCR